MNNLIENYLNLYDAIFVVVIFLFFIISYRNGLLYSVVSLFKVLGSAVLSGYISNRYSYNIYERFMKDSLIKKVSEKLSDFNNGLINTFGNDAIGKAISEYLGKTALGSDVNSISEMIIEGGLQDTIVGGIKLIIFVIVFLIMILILSWIQSILLHTNEVPVLGFLNRLLGGIFGVLMGIVILYIMSMLINVLLDYGASFLSEDDILSSHLFSYIYKLNPFFK